MSEQMAAKMYAELVELRELLERLQVQVELLTRQVNQEIVPQKHHTLSSLINLGTSGLTDVSERHDYYVGEALADEHLR